MKKLALWGLSLATLMLVAGGCAVRAYHHPHPRPVRAVVVHPAPPPRVHVRVRPRPRTCYTTRCRQVCNGWHCWDRCRRVAYRCN